MKLRLLLAIAAMLAVQLLLSQLWTAWAAGPEPFVDPDRFRVNLALRSGLFSLLAVAVGAYIGGRRFLLPALAIWAMLWLASGVVLWRIADGRGSLLELLHSNWMGLLATLLATVIGGLIGGALHRPPHTGRPASVV
ncbi:MAG: hypothetical protein AB7V26_12400 [Lysobacterales bacterium]